MLLRIFDEACSDVVPRAELAALRRAAAAQVAAAVGSPALDPSAAPRVLGNPLPVVRGAAGRPDIVVHLCQKLRSHRTLILKGSTGLGKTSLARLSIDSIGGSWGWAGFRDRDEAQVADLLRRVLSELSALQMPQRIVLDDLPLHVVHRFEHELLALKFALDHADGLLIVTAASACPRDLLPQTLAPARMRV